MARAKQDTFSLSRRRFSLTVRVSLLLVLVTLLPLLIVVVSNDQLSRPALIAQAANAMSTDAQTRVQLIDAYIAERLQDIETFRQFTPIQHFLAGDSTTRQAAFDDLATAHQRDANYGIWSLFSPTGTVLLSYPTQPLAHGKYMVLPGIMSQLHTINRTLISDVYYSAEQDEASLDFYTPVIGSKLLGIMRVSLNLHHIWDIVNSEAGANGAGSYAVIVDHNGVRIAYTNTNGFNYTSSDPSGMAHPAGLFKAIAPLSPTVQQTINDEQLYGNDRKPVVALSDTALAAQLQNPHGSATFQLTPAEQKEPYQVARTSSTILPWTYLVFSPLSTITSIANQQRLYTWIIVSLVLVLTILVGIIVGQRLTSPILRSVNFLLNNSKSLKTLATKELSTATEQKWMVESSQVGLQSVQYYTKATNVAAHRLNEISSDLRSNWQHLNTQTIERYLDEMSTAAKYIENAAEHQEDSSKSLATAIRVTTQVTDQLASGASATNDAANQLESVVDQLRHVVGR